MKSGHNNPPEDISLDLTVEEAQFLMDHCDTNLRIALSVLNEVKEKKTIRAIVSLNEMYSSIRKKLKEKGVKSR